MTEKRRTEKKRGRSRGESQLTEMKKTGPRQGEEKGARVRVGGRSRTSTFWKRQQSLFYYQEIKRLAMKDD